MSDTKLGPTADEAHQAKARKSEKVRLQAWNGTLADLCASDAGRKFVWWVVNDACGFFAAYPGPLGTDAAHFAEGKRWVAAQILDAIKRADPALHQRVLAEGFDPFTKEVNDDD